MPPARDDDDGREAQLLELGSSVRIDRTSTAERVADALRDLITHGDLPAGTPLREQQLVGSLDVSRNTLREAFRLLGRERLVDYTLHRGVAVREVDESDVHDIYRTREPLELMAVEYSAQAPREAVAALLELVEAAEHAVAAEDWKEVATINIVFRVIDAELRLAFAKVEHAPDFFRPFVPRNRAIAELLLVGDRKAAAAELRAYLAEAERMIRAGVSAA